MKIVVTGIGIISAIGCNKQETLDSIQAERSGVGAMQYLQSIHTHLPVGEVKMTNEALREALNIPSHIAVGRTTLLGLAAAREALHDAALQDVSDMAFISGTTVGGMDTTEQHWTQWLENNALDYVHQHEAGASTDTIASFIGDFSYKTTPSTACSSALNAIMIGANLMRTGGVKKALVGGTECLSKFHLNGFNSLMILDSASCRPFDATRAGLNLGEGASYLILENEEDALKRGAHIYGYIAGYGNTCDAHHQTASSPDGEGAYLAMKQALQMANIMPEQVDYINAHGTGTPNNDFSESAAIRRLFSEKIPFISSTKAFTGHTTSASGSIEAAICLLCMQNNIIPANLNWSVTDDTLVMPVVHNVQHDLQCVLCNSFGFGGNDSSLVLTKTGISDLSSNLSNVAISYSPLYNGEEIDYKQFISPIEARRMTKQLRQTLAASLSALHDANLSPDAIICATRYGCMTNSMVFLNEILSTNEDGLKPTRFIQSTHNTMAGLLAIKQQNKGYNITYSSGNNSWNDAILDAIMQMQLGFIQSALVVAFDEYVEDWDNILQKVGLQSCDIAKAQLLTLQN